MSDEKKGDGLVIGLVAGLFLLVMIGVCGGGGGLFFFRAARVQTHVIMERDAAIMEAETARELAEQARVAAEKAADAERAAREQKPAEKIDEKGDANKPEPDEKGGTP